ncbi:MAG: DUF3179 domain-containing (seleno)protein [Pseudomonadales bacterium]|nr:DUF3179 domain-containing (seleno)protein [Pseudomonadales bacterium]MDP6826723.1 DUF3179 domain-containing (seleno)protein [Pseudomonadales bacterium]MDP6972657.1 DUF3179 domain-containing (seleno)protein [Pseudomonadales bacterium]
MLLYDFATESLRSQLMMKAISGPLKGRGLTRLPLLHSTLKGWLTRHSDSLVLTRDTGYPQKRYDRNPYSGYEKNTRLMFPVTARDRRLHPKAWVLGVEIDGRFKAYALEAIHEHGVVEDVVAGQQVRVHSDGDGAWAEIAGREVVTTRAFWFAWYAFHPDTALFDGEYRPPAQAPR